MMFDLLEGNSTIIINVKSKTKNFFPTLYVNSYLDYEISDMIIPPNDEINYTTINDWD